MKYSNKERNGHKIQKTIDDIYVYLTHPMDISVLEINILVILYQVCGLSL